MTKQNKTEIFYSSEGTNEESTDEGADMFVELDGRDKCRRRSSSDVASVLLPPLRRLYNTKKKVLFQRYLNIIFYCLS